MEEFVKELERYVQKIKLRALPGQTREEAENFAKKVAAAFPNKNIVLEFNDSLLTIKSVN
jgi:hypothetical protein